MSDFSLIQRLARQEPMLAEHKTGFDKTWALDYMGSAEFENGESFRSLKRIRAHRVEVTVRPLTVDGVTRDVYFVAHPATGDEQWDKFLAWAAGGDFLRPFRATAPSRFPQVFRGDEYSRPTQAWWALDTDVAWALTAEDAQALADAFNTPAA
ncbi:hypothetical protein [Curtobacterium sp. MCSS17_016]|uniref:hypothetical protein n=1 Tax=Curtobacterium sp. MCSS17_016 TaxID=2175644 RepID=UPI000DA810E2|nr:hypothetical protein [Curtobacterium sp. MCSS17_016]WIE81345.1 hypothetical protein DEJ19_019110 [Curtobacterium sp. MCSS17_016]